METRDTTVADDVAAVRRYWGSEQEYSNDELFAIAQRQWESEHRSGGDAAREFVLQMVANRLEDQLLTWLLQSQVNDTIEDIQTLLDVCLHPCSTENGLGLLETTLDALVTAAVVRAAACDRSAENRVRQIAEIEGVVEAKSTKDSRARDVLRALGKCGSNIDDVDGMTVFSELPCVLDTGLFSSKSARVLMDEAEQVILLQQAELDRVRGSNEGCADVEAREGCPLASNMLWGLAKQMVELIRSKTNQNAFREDCRTDLDIAVDAVECMTNLEAYLEMKGEISLPCGSDRSDQVAADEDAEPSAIELLSSIQVLSDTGEFVSNEAIERAVDELSAIEKLDVIAVQASFLLGVQMRLEVCFLDRFEATKSELERQIISIFNRLVDKAPDSKHTASLVILAAFCPRQVVQQCILGARAGVLHQDLCTEVLQALPLLLEWNENVTYGCGTMFECELQRAVLDVCSNQNTFDRESQNMMSLLQSVVEIPKSGLLHPNIPVMTVSRLVDKVVSPVCCRTGVNARTQLNLYTLVQQLFEHFATTDACATADRSALQNFFQLILGAVRSCDANDLTSRVHVHEKLLLVLKNIMELIPGPVSMAQQLDRPLHPSLWTLLRIFYGDIVNRELCKGWDDVALVKAYAQAQSIGDLHASLPLHVQSVTSAIQVLLWELIWNSTQSEQLNPTFGRAEAWSLLDVIAGPNVFKTDSAVCTIEGSLLIQRAVASIMLACGSVIFQALLDKIIPRLLRCEPNESNAEPNESNVTSGDSLELPKWAADKLFQHSEGELQIPCRLVATHLEMRYVATCWRLLDTTREATATTDAQVLESLSHVLAAQDRAVSSSQGSLSGTLFCVQWLCFVASTAGELQSDTGPPSTTLQIQLELLLLRALHQLERLKGLSASEAQFSQGFVAAWLAYLPFGQFKKVLSFIASRTNN